MSSIDKYIFRTAFGAFALIAASLTGLIWITQALREIDLMTNQGQAILVFVGMTGLLIPVLVLIIAPIALMVAVTYTLNKLNADSEMIVMSASGMSPWRLFVPFIMVALVVSLLVGVIGAYLGPKGLRELRNWAAQLRADMMTTVVKPGRFTTIERGLTIHIRERRNNGQLLGILIDDRRDEKEQATILAERGQILQNERGAFLVLEDGSVHRRETTKRDPAIVQFERYAFDLSRFASRQRQPHAYGARTLPVGSGGARLRTIRSTALSPACFAPNCTTGWSLRSIPWRSRCSPMRSSVRPRPRGRAGRSRSS